MGGVTADEARNMPWKEYQARLLIHNERMDPEGKNEATEAPDAEYFMRQMERQRERGLVH
jgi:hypothetical protein